MRLAIYGWEYVENECIKCFLCQRIVGLWLFKEEVLDVEFEHRSFCPWIVKVNGTNGVGSTLTVLSRYKCLDGEGEFNEGTEDVDEGVGKLTAMEKAQQASLLLKRILKRK